ncbi:MAG: transcriptional repressor [Pirellulaceae bacterium]|jgi:Fur family ferric uptake transcriptional regulator|nr:transcriptional repressor [Pirellulaceae bacterium]
MSPESALDHVPVSVTPLEQFEQYLRRRGRRNTVQRRVVLDCVFRAHDHFDVDRLIEKLPRRGQPKYVSRPTIYRTLAEFVDAGLLRKFELGGRAVYELNYGYPDHDHLYCQGCQSLIEFQSDALVALRDAVAAQHRFRVTGHRLMITGLCAECQSGARRRPRRQPRS